MLTRPIDSSALMWSSWFGARPQFLGPVDLAPRCGPGTREVVRDGEVLCEIVEPSFPGRPRYGMGQDFNLPNTPPPCQAGYVPLSFGGRIVCVPGSPGNFQSIPAQRTFPMPAWGGWTNF